MPTPAKIARWLPPRFIQDCLECACDVGEVIRYQSKGKTLLESTPEQYAELRDRAQYYAGEGSPDGMGDGGGLKRAARALLKSMDAIAEACR